jgi:hypothetical protein
MFHSIPAVWSVNKLSFCSFLGIYQAIMFISQKMFIWKIQKYVSLYAAVWPINKLSFYPFLGMYQAITFISQKMFIWKIQKYVSLYAAICPLTNSVFVPLYPCTKLKSVYHKSFNK